MRTLFDLTGKTAVVTGGAGLLGREHVAALSMAGAKVAIWDLVDAHDPLGMTTVVDVNDLPSLRHAAEALGHIDILVNNASWAAPVGDEREPWAEALSTGLAGPWRCALACKPYGLSVILNIASNHSVHGPDPWLYNGGTKPATYIAMKAGLVGLTRWMATTWAPEVRANALSPGGVENHQDPAFIERYNERVPLKRMAQPEEYRGAVQFLCSDASKYLTGVNLVMDGGRHLV